MAEEAEKDEAAVDPGMERAMNDGWRPKEDWEGDPAGWVDFHDFNVRGEMMGRIKEQSNIIHNSKTKLETMEATIADLVEMNAKTAERAYEQLLGKLKRDKIEAIESADGEAVTQIDEDIDKLKEAHRESRTPKAQESKPSGNSTSVEDPDVAHWLQAPKNQWFNTDSKMRGAATGIATTIVSENPSWSPVQVLAEMEVQMRDLMPHKFRSGSPTDSGDSNQRPKGGGKAKTRQLRDLSEDEQAAAKRFAKTANLPIDKYIEMLDALEA